MSDTNLNAYTVGVEEAKANLVAAKGRLADAEQALEDKRNELGLNDEEASEDTADEAVVDEGVVEADQAEDTSTDEDTTPDVPTTDDEPVENTGTPTDIVIEDEFVSDDEANEPTNTAGEDESDKSDQPAES